MEKEELLYILALQRIPGIGDITAKKLIAHCGSAEAVFREKKQRLLKIDRVGEFALRDINNRLFIKQAEDELKNIEKYNIEYKYFKNDDYPERLKHCIDGPLIIFQKGKIDLNNKRVISVVGTRKITSYGSAFCERFIEELSPFNPVIVSGFAYGVDICAQKTAVKNGLQTIGCLAHGLNFVYPGAHRKYVEEIERNGGFISDFWADDEPEKNNFLKRNRIIAGLSEATVVIESAEKGGGLVTADIANSYNREVFAVPGRAEDKYSSGCNNLIKNQQAHMLTSAADLVYLLNWKLEEDQQPVVQKQLFVELDASEKLIYNFLQDKGKELMDIIALECRMPVHKISAALLSMEMKGVVRPLPGKLFEAI